MAELKRCVDCHSWLLITNKSLYVQQAKQWGLMDVISKIKTNKNQIKKLYYSLPVLITIERSRPCYYSRQ